MKTNHSCIVLITHMTAGHFGAPDRFQALEEKPGSWPSLST
jgi:protease II